MTDPSRNQGAPGGAASEPDSSGKSGGDPPEVAPGRAKNPSPSEGSERAWHLRIGPEEHRALGALARRFGVGRGELGVRLVRAGLALGAEKPQEFYRWGVSPEKGGGAVEEPRGAGARRGATLHLPVPSAERAVLGVWAERVGLSPVVLVRYALRVGVQVVGQWSPGDFLQRTARGPARRAAPSPPKGPVPAVEPSGAPAARAPVYQAQVSPAAPATPTAPVQAPRAANARPPGPNPMPTRFPAPAVRGSSSGMQGGPSWLPSPAATAPSTAHPGSSGGVLHPGSPSCPVPPVAGSPGFTVGRRTPWKP